MEKNNNAKKAFYVSVLLAVFFVLAPFGFVRAENIGDTIVHGLNIVGKTGFGVETDSGDKIPVIHPAQIAAGVIGVAISSLGIFFFGLMLYSGYVWLTAYGDEEKAAKAMKVARRAVVGLGIVMAAYIISIAGFYYLSRVAGGKYYYPPGGTDYWRDLKSGYECTSADEEDCVYW